VGVKKDNKRNQKLEPKKVISKAKNKPNLSTSEANPNRKVR